MPYKGHVCFINTGKFIAAGATQLYKNILYMCVYITRQMLIDHSCCGHRFKIRARLYAYKAPFSSLPKVDASPSSEYKTDIPAEKKDIEV